MTKANLFPTRDESAGLPAELLETLAESKAPLSNLRIERILSPPDHSSKSDFWYDQPTTEWVLLLQGSATLRFQNPDGTEETTELAPGDYLEIPPHQRHRIDATHPTGPTLWLAIHWS